MYSRLDRIGEWAILAPQAEFNSKKLAALCKVSSRQLERYFRRSFQKSPQTWLNAVRLYEAARLLHSGASVKETAFHLGFKQVSHFSREFKRHVGIAPNIFVSLQTDDNVARG